MAYRNCQNPKCHYYDTVDRLRGPKDNKVYTTRKNTNYWGIACTLNCLSEYWDHNKDAIQRAIPEMEPQARPRDQRYNWSDERLEPR